MAWATLQEPEAEIQQRGLFSLSQGRVPDPVSIFEKALPCSWRVGYLRKCASSGKHRGTNGSLVMEAPPYGTGRGSEG